MATTRENSTHDIEQPYGSVLGIIDTDPNVKLPRVAIDTGGNPRGIDVRHRASGIGHLHQGSGFSSTDMGSGGDGVGMEADIGPERFLTH